MGVDQTGPPVAAAGDRAVLYAVRGRPGPFDPDRQRVAQAAVSAEWGSAAVTLVSEAAHLAAFGSLWIVQYLLLDWILFASRHARARGSNCEISPLDTAPDRRNVNTLSGLPHGTSPVLLPAQAKLSGVGLIRTRSNLEGPSKH